MLHIIFFSRRSCAKRTCYWFHID